MDDAFIEAIRESGDEESAGPATRRAPWGDFFGVPNLTEADGRFDLRGLPAAKYTVHAYRKGGGEGFVEHVEPGSDIVVTIGATGRLAGAVRVPGGAPPEEFSLVVVEAVTGFRRSDNFFRTGGAWSVPELPAGRYKIHVHAGAATAQSEASVREGEDTTDVSIELTPKVSVQGSVIDASGAPIAGVQVTLRSAQGGPSSLLDEARRYMTDAAGRFELAGAPTGDVELVLVRPGAGAHANVETLRIPMKLSGAAPTVELGPIRWPGMGAPSEH
ncbi:carboxypeptidase regulatory-like domain-containing protein [Nannocystis pusilla]|uniref:carboxypeptidase-like regulatory domain-containing protein n=1 Tax=Nannocystis pusilla TaxID=889268 RepID=UPI003DA557D6